MKSIDGEKQNFCLQVWGITSTLHSPKSSMQSGRSLISRWHQPSRTLSWCDGRDRQERSSGPLSLSSIKLSGKSYLIPVVTTDSLEWKCFSRPPGETHTHTQHPRSRAVIHLLKFISRRYYVTGVQSPWETTTPLMPEDMILTAVACTGLLKQGGEFGTQFTVLIDNQQVTSIIIFIKQFHTSKSADVLNRPFSHFQVWNVKLQNSKYIESTIVPHKKKKKSVWRF